MAKRTTERLNANVLAALEDAEKSKIGLADAIGLSRRSVFRRFNDAQSWTYAELVRTAAYIGVPVATLTEGVEELYAADVVVPAEERSA
jgi:hypothetical protein